MSTEETMAGVIELLRGMDPQKRAITPQTLIFSELDFDSLKMIDLIETLKKKYGVDFFAAPFSLLDLRTPTTLVAAIGRAAAGQTPATVQG